VRLAISVHGALEPWALGFRRWKKRLAWAGYQRRTLELADMIFVTTEQEAQSVRRTGVRRPLAVVPIGVETAAPLPEVVREEGTCLFLSRIHPKKGLEAWVRAWAEVSPSWRMSIAGPDADGHRQQIETLVRDLGLARHFTFHGEVHGRDKAALFAAADVFVLPSHSENFGMVVPEALAAATPVLTTSATPWSQLPALGAGWCVEPTTHGLARGLREVLATPAAERRRMGERGRAYVARELAWPAIAQKTIEAYEWMSGGGHARPAHVHLD
jgi:glycosyltransferase involved in cell wall biosynthesis